MKLPGLTIGIVADDLTGANDTALQFFHAGCPTRVLLDTTAPPPPVEDCKVWTVNTESRHLDVLDASVRVRRAVALMKKQYGVEHFYKKIDSTLRGHIAQECLAVLEELKWDCAFIVPAFPYEGRQTVGGYQLVRGVPVEQTEVGRDPHFPVRQSHIPTLLGEATKPTIVGHIELSTVLHGAGPLFKAMIEQIEAGKRLVVVDACTPVDLEQVALALEKVAKTHNVLPCGSGGLAKALSRQWPGDTGDSPRADVSLPQSPVLVVNGSNSETSRNQVNQLLENYGYYGEGSKIKLFALSAEKLLGVVPANKEVEDIVTALNDKNTVVVTASPQEDSLQKTFVISEEHGIPADEVSERVQKTLASLAVGVYGIKQCKLVLCGGETSFNICGALGVKALEMIGEIETSVPLLREQTPHSQRLIVTKSGNFASGLALANIVQYLKQHESSSVHA